jgi:ribonuclease Z
VELVFLGTGAGMPSSRRNVTSIALRFSEDKNSFWLFDCGEATQHQIMKTTLKLSKLDMIFITHLHGDHLFGLPGLLNSRSNQGVKTSLRVFGPAGLKAFIEMALRTSGSHLGYELQIIELSGEYVPGMDEPFYEDDRFRIYCAWLDHRVDCLGYRVEEKDKPGKLDVQRLVEAGVPSGPLYGRLKNGEDIELADGTWIRAQQVVSRPIRGRIVAIMGDTRTVGHVKKLADRADVLVHEATFGKDARHLAYEYHHSTTDEAAETARQAGVKTLILTHISARYQDESIDQLLQEAQTIFPNTYIAEDYWIYTVKSI